MSVKNAFSGLFFRKQKGARVFQRQEDINVVVISAPLLIFSHNILGNVHYVPEINLISSGILIKAFYFPSKKSLKKSETSKDERQLKTIISKQTFPRIYLVHFCP